MSYMIQINVALMNGDAELRLPLPPSSTVQDLMIRAQQAFGKKHLRLITAKNRVLVHFEQTLEEAEIADGEWLTALVLQPQLAATKSAFALWCHGDCAIVTWGDARRGGDSSAVRDQLRGVQQIQATPGAFAAILADGSVVTWGDANRGGDSSEVREQLKGVQQIQATDTAFAAILEGGSVVTWGSEYDGGDSSAVQDQLRGVRQIQATERAFAAIVEDGSVVAWGDANYGGDSSAVQDQLRGVRQIQATERAFAAILEDGSVVTWGDARRHRRQFEISSGVCSKFRPHLGPLLRFWQMDSVVTWGLADFGGDSSAVRDQLRGVQQIQSTCRAFAAILEDGSVVAWGYADFWVRDISDISVRDQLRGVWQIQATNAAFAAILGDGSVVSWGDRSFGGDR